MPTYQLLSQFLELFGFLQQSDGLLLELRVGRQFFLAELGKVDDGAQIAPQAGSLWLADILHSQRQSPQGHAFGLTATPSFILYACHVS